MNPNPQSRNHLLLAAIAAMAIGMLFALAAAGMAGCSPPAEEVAPAPSEVLGCPPCSCYEACVEEEPAASNPPRVPLGASSDTTHFTNISAADIATTDDLTVGDDINVTGDLKVGDGTPSITQNGEDAYIEGTFEVDGASEFDGALNVDGAADFDSTVDIAGNVSDGGGTFTFADDVLVDGAADAVQLTVQGYTTQTNSLQVWETSGGTDVGTMSNAGALHIASALTFGTDDLYPIGFDGTTYQYEIYFGSASTVTQTQVTSATHNMTAAVSWAICFVSDPDADAGDPFLCVPTISGTSVTFQALDDDGDAASTAATTLYYLIIGR